MPFLRIRFVASYRHISLVNKTNVVRPDKLV